MFRSFLLRRAAGVLAAAAILLATEARALRPAWTADVPGATHVALAGANAVVATGARVRALDLATGKVLFDVEAPGAIQALDADARSVVVRTETGAAVLDPASGKTRFVHVAPEGLHAASPAGSLVVLVQTDGAVLAVDADSGKAAWRQILSGRPAAVPAATEAHVLVADEAFVHALRRADGSRAWRFAVFGPGPPVPAGDAVVVAAAPPRFATSLAALSGVFRWTYPIEPRASLAPLFAGGMVYLAAPLPGAEPGAARTLLRALDAAAGTLVWAAAIPGEVTALAAASDLVFAAEGANLHALHARQGWLAESVAARGPVRRIAAAPGTLLALGDGGRLEAFSLPAGVGTVAPTEAALRTLVAAGPSRADLEDLAVRFARREIEMATGEALGPSGALVVSRQVAADPLLGRPVLALEILAEDRYLCRVKVAADALEVLSWHNEQAAAGSELVEVSRAQADLLTRDKAPLPEGATIARAGVELDREGKAYLDVRWVAPGSERAEVEMRLHPRTGALISLVVVGRLPVEAVSRWRAALLAAPSPGARTHPEASEEPRRLLPGEIRHYRLASQAYDVAYDGRWMWVTTNGGLYRVDPATGEHLRLTTRDGLLDNEVTAVAASKEQDVWVASARGLTRLREGRVARYPFEISELRRRDVQVRQLLLRKDEVWAATSAGVVRWRRGAWAWFGRPHGLLSENVRGIARGRKGVIWAATEEGVARFDGLTWTVMRERDGLPQNDIAAVAVDRRGGVWAATAERGVARFDGKRWKLYKQQTAYGVPEELGPPSNRIRDFALDTPGGVWGVWDDGLTRFFRGKWANLPLPVMLRGRKLSRVVLAGRRMLCVARGPGQGLLAFDGRAWQPDFVPPDRSEPPSADWVVVSGDVVWAGARAYGIARYAGGKWTRHNVDVGPHSGVLRATESAAPDGKGGLWVGARGTICRYQGSWSCEKLGSHPVSSIALDPQGRLWVGTRGAGIARQSGGVWVRLGEREGLPGLVVRQVLVAPDGSLFGLVEVERGRAAVVRLGPGETRFQILGSSEGMGVAPTALATDAEGRVWVGTAAATLYRWDGKRLEAERRYDGLRAAAVTRLAFDRGNHPWVIHEGTRGVRHHDGNRWVAFERATGLLSDVARDLAVAPGGAIWVATDEGLTAYVPKE